MQNHGFFDYPGIVFDEIYYWIQGYIPNGIIIVLMSFLAAYISMWVYARFSKQEILKELKPRQKQAQKNLAQYDGPFNGLMPLIKNNLKLSAKHMWLTFFPALLATIPLLFILPWLSNNFSVNFPTEGQEIKVEVHSYTPYGLNWISSQPIKKLNHNQWLIKWPGEHKKIKLKDEYSEKILSLPLMGLSPILHKKQWWNKLIANPAQYLNDDSLVQELIINYPEQQYISFGPNWLRGWLPLFMIGIITFSLFFKWRWRIH